MQGCLKNYFFVMMVIMAGTLRPQSYDCPSDSAACYQATTSYYEDAPYAYDGYWQGGRRKRTDVRVRKDGRTRGTPRSTGIQSSGPSYATMSRTPVSGGLWSGGHMSGSMGAGATIGHGHR